MAACLYDQHAGYYARPGGRPIGGPRADFTTAPAAHPAFAAALAVEVDRVWAGLGRPAAGVDVVEVGPGDGALAAGLLAACTAPITLTLVEAAPGMAQRQRDRLAGAPARHVAAPEDLTPVRGVVVANELYDALPVHLLRGRAERAGATTPEGLRLLGGPAELFVAVGADGDLTLVEGEPSRDDLAGLTLAPGETRAIAPSAASLYARAAARLAAGELWTFDYGSPDGPGHSVRVYRGGFELGLEAALEAPGRRDLTADVDFGALRRAGERAGLVTVRDGSQATWLAERLAGLGRTPDAFAGPAELRLAALAAPGPIGDAFRVLVQARA